jgi:hypothetical protein
MTAPISDDAMRELCEKASEEPWFSIAYERPSPGDHLRGVRTASDSVNVTIDDDAVMVFDHGCGCCAKSDPRNEDFLFAAAARSWIPAALERLAKLEMERAQMDAVRREWVESCERAARERIERLRGKYGPSAPYVKPQGGVE